LLRFPSRIRLPSSLTMSADPTLGSPSLILASPLGGARSHARPFRSSTTTWSAPPPSDRHGTSVRPNDILTSRHPTWALPRGLSEGFSKAASGFPQNFFSPKFSTMSVGLDPFKNCGNHCVSSWKLHLKHFTIEMVCMISLD
jgi:hypothetical protein